MVILHKVSCDVGYFLYVWFLYLFRQKESMSLQEKCHQTLSLTIFKQSKAKQNKKHVLLNCTITMTMILECLWTSENNWNCTCHMYRKTIFNILCWALLRANENGGGERVINFIRGLELAQPTIGSATPYSVCFIILSSSQKTRIR